MFKKLLIALRAISIAPIIVEKNSKERPFFVDGSPARHERHHSAFVVHLLGNDLRLHPLIYPR